MSLRARMVLVGAVVPALALALAVLAGRVAFGRQLLSAIDDAMRTQAAVEAVSLFDRAGAEPHLHLRWSPLAAGADASIAAVYDASGAPVVRWPEEAEIPPRIAAEDADDEPRVRTVETPRGSRRELVVAVTAPHGARYALWLGHDLAPHEATLEAYDRTGAAFVLLAVLVLFATQIVHAQWLTRRIGGLASHMARLREGDLEAEPPRDVVKDRLGELRDSIADATAKLRMASRARDRLVADAAHELRTPLATMRAGIDVTLRRERSADELREQLGHLRDEVDRLGSVAADLLELASGGRAEEERVLGALDDVVDEAIAAHEGRAASRGVTLRRSGEGGSVRHAPRAMRRAIDNLITNAIAFAPAGSSVDVHLESGDGVVRARVRDRGPGIPTEERDAIFEPFHRVDRSRPGTGLGLAIVRDVARRHGGRAYASAREGGGAELVLELPAASAPQA